MERLKVGIQSLLGYLPATVIKNILDGDIDSKKLPSYYKINTVSLMADISGFTKLSESFAKKGRIGPEFLAFSLNRYMEQLINIIGKNGGDIFKFAGDALLVIWPQAELISQSCIRAIQCALDIQSILNDKEISPNKTLSVKIGIGVGECMILVVGGQFLRCEYLCVGDAMAEACLAETKATKGGQTICSEKVKNYVEDNFEFELAKGDDHGHGGGDENEGNFFMIKKMTGNRVQTKADAFIMRSQFSNAKLRDKLQTLKSFVPAAIVKYLDLEKESWCKEIRMLGIMFLNLKIDLSHTRTDEGIQRIQAIVKTVQRCVYRTKGGLNKFLMDDKGSVMLICWGLPPLSADDDHIRSVFTGLTLIEELKKFKCGAYMGVTTGSCFTGVCGTIGGRREYSLLGEIVNLSARHMQKAIYYAIDLTKETKSKVDYMMLLDERTKDLIQNKIFCEYKCEDNLKGFTNKFQFYMPMIDQERKDHYSKSLFPNLRTHRKNIPLYQLPQNIMKEKDHNYYLQCSLYMIGRENLFDSAQAKLLNLINHKSKEIILVRGNFGSGKTLFIRNLLYRFVDDHKIKFNFESPNIFISFQSPITIFNPINGWNQTLKRIYGIIINYLRIQKKLKTDDELINIGQDSIKVNCDPIGKLIFESDSYSCIRYIEEILETQLEQHFKLPNNTEYFSRFYKIKEIPQRDPFFSQIDYARCEKTICRFFYKLLKLYQNLFFSNSNIPLVFVLEDCHLMDEISFEMIRMIRTKKIKNIAVICSFQDSISPSQIKHNEEKLIKYIDCFDAESELLIDSITDPLENKALIINHLEKEHNMKIRLIDDKLIKIIVTKAFKGNPLLILDIVDSIIKSPKLFKVDSNGKLMATEELEAMEENNDWSNFFIPIRIEKIIGNIIDSFDIKNIILLKHASVIGNLFDIDKLNDLNPFDSLTFEDLRNIILEWEEMEIIEILYDLNPKHTICKFSLPFFREVLYQRMLIEQKNDIHLNVARLLQISKFNYIPHSKEIYILQKHLKITEKSIINHMEEDDEPTENQKTEIVTNTHLNLNNLKILQVKDICEKLKSIDLRLDSMDDELSKASNPLIKSGVVMKKSDKNITWESRFLVITKTKCQYFYTKQDYKENKQPLGSFDLKNLYIASILPDFTFGRVKHSFMIHVSSWVKKDIIMGERKYFFSDDHRDSTYNWVISLNFLRVKAIYYDFTSQFGIINLPLKHEMHKKKRKLKKKFNQFSNLKNKQIPQNYYNLHERKSQMNKGGENSRLTVRASTLLSANGSENFEEENTQEKKVNRIKENIIKLFNIGFVLIFSRIQNIIFDIEQISSNEEKIISIPKIFEASFIETLNSKDTLNSSTFNYTNMRSSLFNSINSPEKKQSMLLKPPLKEVIEESFTNNKVKNSFEIYKENMSEVEDKENSQIIQNRGISESMNLISSRIKNFDATDRDLDLIFEEMENNEKNLLKK